MLEELQTLTYTELFLRIFLAALFGCILGLDRDVKNKPVDFRAYMVVCVSTCLVAIMGQELQHLYQDSQGFISLDLGKIISGALTGIGFLGAGAILKNTNDKGQIIGSTTGASIWGSAIIGLCLGFGFIFLALTGFAVILGTLVIAGWLLPTIHGYQDKEKTAQE